MIYRLLSSLFVIYVISFNALAMNSDNPFSKNEALNIGTEIRWNIDKKTVTATKTINDGKGIFYHLQFNNRAIKLVVSNDAGAAKPKLFKQLEILDVRIDNKQVPLFKWCLNNQQRHNRFLQQGLQVKKSICSIDGEAGTFVLQLNKDTLISLQQGRRLKLKLKPFRTPLDLNYDISDFKGMYIALNSRVKPDVTVNLVPQTSGKNTAGNKVKTENTKCQSIPPTKYKNIKPIKYNCNDAESKKSAEALISKQVDKEVTKTKKLVAEKTSVEENQRKLEKQRQQELQAETAIIAASQAKQQKIGNEITQKMVNVCSKIWDSGEHRCYCQKYIKYAPSEIQESSTCK